MGKIISIRLAVLLGIGFILHTTFSQLSQVKPFKIQHLLAEDHPLRIYYENYKKQFDDEAKAFVLVKKDQGNFTYPEIETVSNLFKKELRKNPYITKITSPLDSAYISHKGGWMELVPFIENGKLSEEAGAKISEDFYKNSFFKEDGSALLFHIMYNPSIPDSKNYEALDLLIKASKKFENKWSHVSFYPMGTKVANYYFENEMVTNQTIITPLLLLLIGVFFYFQFRSIAVVAASMLVMILAYSLTLSSIIWIENGLGPYSSFALFFVFIVATSDLIHYFSKLTQPKDASSRDLKAAAKDLIAPCFLTSLTTAIGFSSLMLNENQPIRLFGLYCAIGTFTCFGLSFYFLPWLLKVFSFKPERIAREKFQLNDKSTWNFIERSYKKVLVGSVVIFAIFMFQGRKISIDDNVYESFNASHDLSQSVKHYSSIFSFMGSIDITFQAKRESILSRNNESLIRSFEQKVESLPNVSYIKSYTQLQDSIRTELRTNYPSKHPDSIETSRKASFDVLHGYNVFDSIYSESANMIRTIVFLDSLDSDVLNETIVSIEKLAATPQFASLKINPGGFSVIRNYINTTLILNFIKSFALSFVLIFVFFSLLFRSITWGAICMIPNVFPVLTIAGLMGIFGVTMESNLIILVCITLGLGVDDTIHFAYHLKKGLKENLDFKGSVMSSFQKTSGALISTTLVFLVSFPVFFIGDLRLYTQVGIFILLALIVALIADFLVLPSVLLQISKNKGDKFLVKKLST